MSLLTAGRIGLTAALLAWAMSAASAQTFINFSLDTKFEGSAAPFLVAKDKGYFKQEGLDVTVDSAASAIEPITRIASGTHEVAVADVNTLIRFRDANPSNKMTAVFIVHNRPGFAIIGRKSRGVSQPKDLEGKKLGAPSTDAAFAQWPVFVQATGIDASKVAVDNIGLAVREPMLQSGQVDAISGLSFTSFINLKSMNVPVNDLVVMMMADYGVNLYGNAIIVSQKFAAEKPEAVKGFLRAYMKGLRDTLKSPDTAVEAVLRRNDAARKDAEVERLRMALKDSFITDEVKKNGWGAIDNARMAAAIDQIALSYKFKGPKPTPADIFDASFLPNSADRKF